MRSFIEVYLVTVVILLSVPAGRLGARFAWVLPALGASMVEVGAGVVHRGLTIPFRGTGPVRTRNPVALNATV